MGFRRQLSRVACVLLPLAAISCADSGGPALVEVQYNLTCPSDVDCGPLAGPGDSVAACLGGGGRREFVGGHGSMLCGEPLLAICEASRVSEGLVILNLEANIENQFAFELLGARFDPDSGSMMGESACRVTIIEDEAIYGGNLALGACGMEEPSPEQPCQIDNVVFASSEVSFDLRCDALMSDTLRGFNVGGIGSEWATMRFSRCSGF